MVVVHSWSFQSNKGAFRAALSLFFQALSVRKDRKQSLVQIRPGGSIKGHKLSRNSGLKGHDITRKVEQ